MLDGTNHQVARVEYQLPGALSFDLDDQPGIGCLDNDFVIEAQCQSETVEARAEVGPGGRDDRTGRQPGGKPPTRVSGSFRPLPGTVHPTVDPGATQPSPTDLSRPAMLAAEAGSTK